jgi:hypothetical protein
MVMHAAGNVKSIPVIKRFVKVDQGDLRNQKSLIFKMLN